MVFIQAKWLEMLQSKEATSIFQPPTYPNTSRGSASSIEENEIPSISARHYNNDSLQKRWPSFCVQKGSKPRKEAEICKRPFLWLQPLVSSWCAWFLEWDAQCIALTVTKCLWLKKKLFRTIALLSSVCFVHLEVVTVASTWLFLGVLLGN